VSTRSPTQESAGRGDPRDAGAIDQKCGHSWAGRVQFRGSGDRTCAESPEALIRRDQDAAVAILDKRRHHGTESG
jgi:hypothetical protein